MRCTDNKGNPGSRCEVGKPEIQNGVCDAFTFGEKDRETWTCAYEFAHICEKEKDDPNTEGEGRDRVRWDQRWGTEVSQSRMCFTVLTLGSYKHLIYCK